MGAQCHRTFEAGSSIQDKEDGLISSEGYAWGLSQQEMRKGRGNISYLSGWPDQSQCTALQQNRLRYLIPKPKHPGTAVSESL